MVIGHRKGYTWVIGITWAFLKSYRDSVRLGLIGGGRNISRFCNFTAEILLMVFVDRALQCLKRPPRNL